jgi:4-amino-4-deoxy-L-arabinose transferase-like glycosyltransferase
LSERLARLFDALVCLALMAYIVAGVPLVPFHGDEATQIYMSRDYAYQFIERDLARIAYSDPPISATEQHLRLLNGTINKSLIGLAWHLGGWTAADLNEQWDWGGDWNYNLTAGHLPPDALLHTARLPSALLLALGVPLMFSLGSRLGGRKAAILAALLYALHPGLLVNGRRAMMEGSLTFFSLLTVYAGVLWLSARRQWAMWLSTALLGMAAGAALTSKHSALFAVAAVLGVCALVMLWRGWLQRRERGWRSLLLELARLAWAGGIGGVVFLALNPAWWGAPLARLAEVLRLRQDLLTGQTAAFGGYADAGAAFMGWLRAGFISAPQFYEVPAWADDIGGQIAAYQASGLAGLPVSATVTLAAIILTLLGLLLLWRRRATAPPARVVIGVWAVGMFASTALLTPLNWARYYLPAYPAVALLVALAISSLIDAVTALQPLRQASSAPSSS